MKHLDDDHSILEMEKLSNSEDIKRIMICCTKDPNSKRFMARTSTKGNLCQNDPGPSLMPDCPF